MPTPGQVAFRYIFLAVIVIFLCGLLAGACGACAAIRMHGQKVDPFPDCTCAWTGETMVCACL